MNQTADLERRVMKSIEASIDVKQSLLRDAALVSAIAKVSEILVAALTRGNKLLLFGNGGSAADAQHIAAEFRWPLRLRSSCLARFGPLRQYFLSHSHRQRLRLRANLLPSTRGLGAPR